MLWYSGYVWKQVLGKQTLILMIGMAGKREDLERFLELQTSRSLVPLQGPN